MTSGDGTTARTTALEASAGTGKTYDIAMRAVRLLAGGDTDMAGLLVVTFGRAATREVRERVRERLRAAANGGFPVGGAAERDRIVRALAEFDAATIVTTHGFCQLMLAGLGLAADLDRPVTLLESLDEVVDEVVPDLYVGRYARTGPPDGFGLRQARAVVAAAVADPHAVLVPHGGSSGADGGSWADGPDLDDRAAERYAFAAAGRRAVAQRLAERRLITYDDLLSRLRDALADPVTGPAARVRVRSHFRAVLVDEFQDTDPVQWAILRTAFHGHVPLALIGDPKQAIYGFRGGDVVTYLAATRLADERATLGTNWRSDADLLAGLAAIMGGAALGDPAIVVRPVVAEHVRRRLVGGGPPVRLRFADRTVARTGKGGLLPVQPVRELVARDVAGTIGGLLRSGATLALGEEPPRPVRPGDVTVLVATHAQARLVRDHLLRQGIPAVVTGAGSVFGTGAAAGWLQLLEAMDSPHRDGLVRAAALTRLVGWDAASLATADYAAVAGLAGTIRRWRHVLLERGVAALLEEVAAATDLTGRLLAEHGGERHLTDLRHVAEALHTAAGGTATPPSALAEWLRQRIDEAGGDRDEQRSRRLETDAEAVQIATVHASKGLQFPVVCVPYAWDRSARVDADTPLRFHDPDTTRRLDVGGGTGVGRAARRLAHLAEDAGEQLRLCYVALTRGECQTLLWWAPASTATSAPLHRLLFGDRADDGTVPEAVPVPTDDEVAERLAALAAASDGTLQAERLVVADGVRWQPPATAAADLACAGPARVPDLVWRRTSYTAIVRGTHPHGEGAGSEPEPEDQQREDEADGTGSVDREAGGPLAAVPSPMADLPAGRSFGTLVHEVLERLEPHPDRAALRAALVATCGAVLARRPPNGTDAGTLAAALEPALTTPLGPLADGLALADVPASDRRTEMAFELGLGGATVGDVAALWRATVPPDDPLTAYGEDLELLTGTQPLRGFLTGSIDAVLRVPGGPGGTGPRAVVVDYKTNRLGGWDGPAGQTAWHYRPAALAVAMRQSHYPLQALLYAVAVHRWLRWRQRGYDPRHHLGGVLYLFLRGMVGPGAGLGADPAYPGSACGVFAWRPPVDLVTGVSALLGEDR